MQQMNQFLAELYLAECPEDVLERIDSCRGKLSAEQFKQVEELGGQLIRAFLIQRMENMNN